jgi:hypothetical protein
VSHTCAIAEHLDRTVIHLGQGLDLEVVSIHPIPAFPLAVGSKVLRYELGVVIAVRLLQARRAMIWPKCEAALP